MANKKNSKELSGKFHLSKSKAFVLIGMALFLVSILTIVAKAKNTELEALAKVKKLSVSSGSKKGHTKSVSGYFIPSNTITSNMIVRRTIDSKDIATEAVDSRIIEDHSIQSRDLEKNIKIRGDLTVEGTAYIEDFGSEKLYISQASAPEDSADQLYNFSGNLFWNGISLTGGGALPIGVSGQTLYNSSGSWLSTSNLYNDGTNIGIGTADPNNKLTVIGDAYFSNHMGVGDSVLYDVALNSEIEAGAGEARIAIYGSAGNVSGSDAYWIKGVIGQGWVRGGGTVDNATGLEANVGASAGSITNGYGVYINEILGTVTNKFGLYQEGVGDINYFAGNIGIGTASPGAKLEANGYVAAYGLISNPSTTSQPLRLEGRGSVLINADNNNDDPASSINFYINGESDANMKMIILENGNVGIGTASPNYRVDVVGVINATGLKINGIDVTSSSDTYWNANASGIDYSAGNVGIGTTNPTYPLEVRRASAGPVSLAKFTDSNRNGWSVSSDSTNSAYLAIEYSAGNRVVLRASQYLTSIIGTTFFDSNVGIGTTAPTGTLDVRGGTASGSSSGSPITIIAQAAGPSAGLGQVGGDLFLRSGSGTGAESGGGNIILMPGVGGAGGFTGMIGIGTTSPNAKVDVYGPDLLHADSTGVLTVTDSASVAKDVGGSIALKGYTSASYGPQLLGAIKAGKTNATDAERSGYLAFITSNNGSVTEQMRIDSLGSVGIGTTNPGYKLEVAGGANSAVYATSSIGGPYDWAIYGSNSSGGIGVRGSSSSGSGLYGGSTTGKGLEVYTSNGSAYGIYQSGTGIGAYFAGNVGIGTTAPNNLLQVQDLISFNNTDNNTQIGYWSGKNIVSGAQYNTFLGYQAGYSNSVGGTNEADNNTAIGYGTLAYNTTGGGNSVLGVRSMESNRTGNYNSAAGMFSLFKNTSGSNNSAFGFSALSENDTGSNNAAFGQYALYYNSTGVSSVGIGSQAGYYNETGNYNTILGAQAGMGSLSQSNSNNTFIGYRASYSNSTGGNNVSLGYQAGYSNTTGSGNVFLGYQAGYNSVGSNKLFIANSNGAPLIYGDFSTGNVGIGTTAPGALLDVNGLAQLRGSDGGTGLYVNSSGYVGIGTTSIGAKLDILSDNGGTALYLHSAIPGYGPAFLINEIDDNTSGSAYNAEFLSIYANPASASTGTTRGIYSKVVYSSSSASSPSAELVGLFGEARNENFGGYTLGWAKAVAGRIGSYGMPGTAPPVTNGAALYAESPYYGGMNSSAITNAYGLYIAQQKIAAVVTNGYGVYQAYSGDLNYFAGNVGIGTTSPGGKIDIRDGTLVLSDADVTHGMTDLVPTNVYARLSPTAGLYGGLDILALSDGNTNPFSIAAIFGTDDPDDSTAAIYLSAGKKNGTTYQSLGATETVLQVTNTNPLFTILGGGNVGIGTINPGTAGLAVMNGNVGIGTTAPNNLLQVLDLISFPSSNRTFIGYQAGKYDLGSNNTYIGYQAGSADNATGKSGTASSNVAVGYQALYPNDSGDSNTALGTYSLAANISGSYNTASGMQSLFYNTTGISNSAFGYAALFNNGGNGNTAVGVSALNNNSSGGYNVAIGISALYGSGTASNNVAVGSSTLYMGGGGSGNVALGHYAGSYNNLSNAFYVNNVNQSTSDNDKNYSLLYGNFSGTGGSLTNQFLQVNGKFYVMGGNVGIGTTSPTQKLEVGGTAWLRGSSGGSDGLYVDSMGRIGIGTTSPSTMFQVNDGLINAGSGSYFVQSGDSGWNSVLDIQRGGTTIGGITSDGTNKIAISMGNSLAWSNAKLVLDASGNVGIGTTNPTQKLDVAGNIQLNTNGLAVLFSSFTGANSSGQNIWIGGGGQSSVGAVGATYKGSYNTSIGYLALQSNTTGKDNTAIGTTALRYNTIGNGNTALGRGALQGNNPGSGNTAAGYGVLQDLSIPADDGTGNNTAIGYNTARGIMTGINNTIIGANVTGLSSTLSNTIIIADGAGNQRIYVNSTGNVGIGTTNPDQALDVIGTIQASNLLGGALNITTDANGNIIRDPSDARLKENIQTATGSLDKVMRLRGVTYNWKDKEKMGSQTDYGMIAQEVFAVTPELTATSADGIMGVKYTNMMGLVVNAIQEQQTQISTHGLQITNQTSNISELQTAVNEKLNVISNSLATTDSKLAVGEAFLANLKTQIADANVMLKGQEKNLVDFEAEANNLLASMMDTEKILTEKVLNHEDRLKSLEDKMTNLSVSGGGEIPSNVITQDNQGNVALAGIFKAKEIQAEIGSFKNVLSAKDIKADNIESNVVVAGEFSVKMNEDDKKTSIGKAKITEVKKDEDGDGIDDETKSDGKSVFVKNVIVKSDSNIFVTSKTVLDQPLVVSNIKPGEGFTVEKKSATNQDITFSWWILGGTSE
jgi:hypothetical protein